VPEPCNDARITRVMNIVMSNLSRRISRVEAARLANLEPGYFSKRFRRVNGCSFAAWTAKMRALAVQDLLANTNLKILAIATEVGYGDVTTLLRNFKKYVGTCPRHYRSLMRGATQNADTKTQSAET
jgi:transcriptional regulator GlxA family with amidase domain